jgi:two-component system sensor histidine kinase CreC
MRIRARLFLAFFILVGIAVWALLDTFKSELAPALRQSSEETLVDTANLLAELAANDLRTGNIGNGALANAVERFSQRRFDADIWGIRKTAPNHRIYVTDATGKVLYDSENLAVGQDYSRWRDVNLTLQGRYGARSSRDSQHPDKTSVMYVAAPILRQGQIIGVLSVGKPTRSLQPFIERSSRKLTLAGVVVVSVALLLGFILAWRLSRAFARLADYAQAVSDGKRATLPQVGGGELGQLANSLETMRQQLEGKAYVDRYVHTLTHEMKSPLAAIRASAELIDTHMPEADRERFLANISNEAAFLQQLVEKLLDLAVIEHRQSLQSVETIVLRALLEEVTHSRSSQIQQRQLQLNMTVDPSITLQGERFLLRQALGNLLDNAIAFCSPHGHISWQAECRAGSLLVWLRDNGSGIPDYALPQVFERFYSLPRPDGSRKSSGLGLAFVREVIALHSGTITLANRPTGGVEVLLTLPASGHPQ